MAFYFDILNTYRLLEKKNLLLVRLCLDVTHRGPCVDTIDQGAVLVLSRDDCKQGSAPDGATALSFSCNIGEDPP